MLTPDKKVIQKQNEIHLMGARKAKMLFMLSFFSV